ncbi:MAG: hypothetical protein CMQ03_02660 [Gammaproteobacteria bacterium]|nr:hypothetical protein [Gammaproteobacteria bacterium]
MKLNLLVLLLMSSAHGTKIAFKPFGQALLPTLGARCPIMDDSPPLMQTIIPTRKLYLRQT